MSYEAEGHGGVGFAIGKQEIGVGISCGVADASPSCNVYAELSGVAGVHVAPDGYGYSLGGVETTHERTQDYDIRAVLTTDLAVHNAGGYEAFQRQYAPGYDRYREIYRNSVFNPNGVVTRELVIGWYQFHDYRAPLYIP
jgi:hypothetical protein